MIKEIDHIVFIVKDLGQTEKFYSSFLGKPMHKSKEHVAFEVGSTKLFFGTPYKNKGDKFDKDFLGFNHIAFRVNNLDDLQKLKRDLEKASIKNSGINIDRYGKKEFIWLDDPNGIRVEFYLR